MDQLYSKTFIISALLVLSGCTETIYQTAPEPNMQTSNGSATANTGIQNDPIATTVPGNTAASIASNDAIDSNPVTSTDTPTPVTSVDMTSVENAGVVTAEVNAQVTDLAVNSAIPSQVPAVTGDPGDIVDCDLQLPCRWVATDEDFMLTVGSVDNTGALDRLSVNYTVTTAYDSELLLGNGSTALEPGGSSFSLVQQSLGSGNSIKAQAVLAGEEVVGSALYNRASESTTLAGWTLTIIDNGLPRTIGFTNLPVGPSNAAAVNCADVLPCLWASTDKDVTITLVAVGGYTANGRLNVNFNVVSERDIDIVLDAGATAVGKKEGAFEGRTHSLGTQSGFAEVTVTAAAGQSVPGSVSFFRTPETPGSLKSLDLVIYESAPTPRWNPTFINLPTQ